MTLRRVLVGALACALLAGCGASGGPAAGGAPFVLPVGPTSWDALAPAWLHDGTLHVGRRSVELGEGVDRFVLGATGAYWVRGGTLLFTSAEGDTEEVADVGWANLVASADRSVLATVDQSHGPTDEYGAHVLQVAVFDTRTGEQRYRTPDARPEARADLDALYPEVMPLLQGVSDEQVFFGGDTIDLDDGSSTPSTPDAERVETYVGYADTPFPDGFHVGLRRDGRRRTPAPSSAFGVGRLSPDRSTLFDTSTWPTPAVAYDATTGRPRAIDAPWRHLVLVGWSDEDTFVGVAQRIERRHPVDQLRARQVVTCAVRTLRCTPVSPVIPTVDADRGTVPALMVEGSADAL